MSRVINKRTDEIPDNAVYVGRPSKWGNPFKVSNQITQKQAVFLYAEWLLKQPDLVEQVQQELRGKDLVCWCYPKPCHADILIRVAGENCNA